MTGRDRQIIRDLAKRIAEIAAQPEQEEKQRLWYAHNSLHPVRPLVFVSPEGSWVELLPDSAFGCEEEGARGIERGLRMRLYAAEHFHDDQVCDNVFRVSYSVSETGWGVEPRYTHSGAPRGAYVWDPPIKTQADIDRIQTPTVTHDPEATRRKVEFFKELLGDLLNVEVHGIKPSFLGIIDEWTRLRGITQTFWDMCDNPQMVHAGMERMTEGKLAWLEALETQGLLGLNNGNDYVASGGLGFTDELPAPDFDGQVRLCDLWGHCESQSMSEVSPAMQAEFVLPYQLRILERFGLNCYGCCEPLHLMIDTLRAQVPRFRRLSISPWADKRVSAEKLGGDVIFSWKPNPAYLAAVKFSSETVRRDIRETVDIAREHGCVLEMILKDTHTCNNEPWRFDEWSRVAMEEALRGAE
ncbi:MAG: hypothetical protein AB7W28_07125 [Armatimonadota bacterium]